MRLIPVMDLRDGVVVHAVKGERKHYHSVESLLSPTADPLVVARAFRDKLGSSELYIADLDAIQGRGDHGQLIAELTQQVGAKLFVDAGVANAESALRLLAHGVAKVIIGSETLPGWDALGRIRGVVPSGRLVFSLDMQGGRVRSSSPELAALSPLELLERVYTDGWQEVILLDLARVGTGAGVDRAMISQARTRFPGLAVLVGGGVRDVEELIELKELGVAGVLLATALHRGVITQKELQEKNLG